MTDDQSDLPPEAKNEIKSAIEEGEITAEDLIVYQIQALIEEAEEELQNKREDTNEKESIDIYGEPYTSGPAMLWRLTDQIGIDSDHVTWWLAVLAHNDDGSPFYLVYDRLDQLNMNRVYSNELTDLADAFDATERHFVNSSTERREETDISDEVVPPTPSEIETEQISEDEWEVVVRSEPMENNEQTLVIRRAPALDQKSLMTYAIERRDNSQEGDDFTPIGAFWGHHSGLFEMRIRDAINRL